MKRHQHRKDLVGEHARGDLGQLIFLGVFLVVWITDSFFLKYSTFLANYIPLFVRIPAAIVILLIAGYLAKNGMAAVFGVTRKEPAVIKKGVFAMTRHPIYLGSILVYLGLLVFTFSIMAMIVWVLMIVFYDFIAKYEEELLLEKFGKDYEQYMKETPRWIPRKWRLK